MDRRWHIQAEQDQADRLLLQIQEQGRPTTGNLAVQVWEFSNHADLTIAQEFMRKAGYKAFMGYPLQRITSRNPKPPLLTCNGG
jgi:hypothetical protein